MTPDLQRLRAAIDELEDLFDRLELDLVSDPAWDEPSDTSYLRPEELEDPDIASNIEAMAATNKLISWFGRDMEGYVGLWRGPRHHPLDRAPVVRLDTEGQYELVATTIGDYLAISVDDDEFDETRRALDAAGFEVAASRDAIWARIDATDDPNGYRATLYEEGRARRGLPMV